MPIGIVLVHVSKRAQNNEDRHLLERDIGLYDSVLAALAARRDVELLVLAFAPRHGLHQSFKKELLEGLEYRLLGDDERDQSRLIAQIVTARKPDVVMVPGWLHKPFSHLPFHPELSHARFIMGMDNPWKGTWRQYLARLKVGSLIGRMDAIFVAGERSWQFARRLGMSEDRIFRCVYGFDLPMFQPVYERRLQAGPWPGRFLYVGRYVREKGFNVMLPAYKTYRASVPDPWPFTFCGQGPFRDAIAAQEGAEDRGFVQPADLPAILSDHGVFVLSSLQEHWCVALAEAMGSGMPAIVSEEVGASVDLIRNCYTGISTATGTPDALTSAMLWMHRNHDKLPEMGLHAREFAAAHSADLWADRCLRMIDVIRANGSGHLA